MRRVWGFVIALAVGLALSFAGAPRADAVCMQSYEGGSCGNCPNLKVIKVYCLQ